MEGLETTIHQRLRTEVINEAEQLALGPYLEITNRELDAAVEDLGRSPDPATGVSIRETIVQDAATTTAEEQAAVLHAAGLTVQASELDVQLRMTDPAT